MKKNTKGLLIRDFIAGLKRRGIRLIPHGNEVVFRAPPGGMTAEIRETIARNRGAILQELSRSNPRVYDGHLAEAVLWQVGKGLVFEDPEGWIWWRDYESRTTLPVPNCGDPSEVH